MERITEPELMSGKEQAIAYASADFEEPHNRFLELLTLSMGEDFPHSGNVIDLGAGAADIAIRFALKHKGFEVDALDGSNTMIAAGIKAIKKVGLNNRIHYIHKTIQEITSLKKEYKIVFSNSLLHHLHDPMILWKLIRSIKTTPLIFIMDLMRPKNMYEVKKLVHKYAENEPDILKKDFENSLKAAFTPDEVVLQLRSVGLEYLKVAVISDRHFIVSNH